MNSWQWVFGVMITVALFLIGIYLKRQEKTIDKLGTDFTADIEGIAKRLDAKIDQVDQRHSDSIKALNNGVVFDDVFRQFEKTQDARYQAIERMIDLFQANYKAAAEHNSAEHSRLHDKLDSLPQLIQSSIKNALNKN